MPLVAFLVLRAALLAAVLGVLWLAGLRSWLLVAVAVVVAYAVSYVALHRPRDAAARWLADRAQARRTSGTGFSATVAADAEAEDAEAAEASGPERRTPRTADTAPAPDAERQGADGQIASPRPSSTP